MPPRPLGRPLPVPPEQQVTFADHGHVLTNANCWSPDGRWIVYDVRSDPMGEAFDGDRIERVHVETGEVQVLYRAARGGHVGVATCSPTDGRVVFIAGPQDPTPDWSYAAHHRQGVTVDPSRPGVATNLDARDLTPPFTAGALRGGSHVHVFSPDGRWVSFTYDDAVVPAAEAARNVAVAVPAGPVQVSPTHARNHDGTFFSVVVTRTVRDPRPGSDDISRACEEGWVGTNGYLRPSGARQPRALAFQGTVRTADGLPCVEVFIVDLPDDPTRPGPWPLEGTASRLPAPPAGAAQRRLTFTADRRYPGIHGPRHWLRSSPDGARIAFLMRDDAGVAQLWTVSPNGGPPAQVSHDPWPVASAFTWNPRGDAIAYVADHGIVLLDPTTGRGRRVTPPRGDRPAPLPLACVFSPDGRRLAYVRPTPTNGRLRNQVFVCQLDS